MPSDCVGRIIGEETLKVPLSAEASRAGANKAKKLRESNKTRNPITKIDPVFFPEKDESN
jgi:hypothetical protein